MTYVGSGIYARSGYVIYRYGGADGDTYDSRTAEVEMPFLNGATIATWKSWTAIDLMIEGLWKVYIATDPEQHDEERSEESREGKECARMCRARRWLHSYNTKNIRSKVNQHALIRLLSILK